MQFDVYETNEDGSFKPIFMLGRCPPNFIDMKDLNPKRPPEATVDLDKIDKPEPVVFKHGRGLSVIESEKEPETDKSLDRKMSILQPAAIEEASSKASCIIETVDPTAEKEHEVDLTDSKIVEETKSKLERAVEKKESSPKVVREDLRVELQASKNETPVSVKEG